LPPRSGGRWGRAYARLIEQGKVRAAGASNFGAGRLSEALKLGGGPLPRYESLQPEYDLYNRAAFEGELEPPCLGQNVGVISYFALASGLLTGKYRSAEDLSKGPRGQDSVTFAVQRGRNSRRSDEPWRAYYKQLMRKRIETAFSRLTAMFPRHIHTTGFRGFLLKVSRFVIAFALDKASG